MKNQINSIARNKWIGYQSVAETVVKGEWLEDIKEPETEKKLINDNEKYTWLKDIIAATRAAAGLAGDLSEAIYRKELSAFFLCSPEEASWPAAPSYGWRPPSPCGADGYRRIHCTVQ